MKIEITLTHITPAILALVQSLHEAHSQAVNSELADAKARIHELSEKAKATAGESSQAPSTDISAPAVETAPGALPESAPKRTRRSRAQIEADEAAAKAAAEPAKAEEPAPLHTTEPAVGAAADPSGDVGLGFLDEDPAPATPAKVYTLAEIRALLTEYGQKNGQEKARSLMREHGKAEKLSDIPATNYAAIAAACGA